jgi:hypothetical protein
MGAKLGALLPGPGLAIRDVGHELDRHPQAHRPGQEPQAEHDDDFVPSGEPIAREISNTKCTTSELHLQLEWT